MENRFFVNIIKILTSSSYDGVKYSQQVRGARSKFMREDKAILLT